MDTHHPIPGMSLVLVIALGSCLPVATAEIYDASQLRAPETGSGSTMANFYTVNPDGESVREDPVESGFALTASGSFDPAQRQATIDEEKNKADKKDEATSPASSRSSTKIIVKKTTRRKSKRSFLKSYKEVQCERHGFFYTSDGRCVVPATRRVIRHPPALPVRPKDIRIHR